MTNVGDRIKALFTNPSARDVYAVLRDLLFVPTQVNGWHRVLGSVAPAAARRRQNRKRAAEEMPRPVRAAGAQQAANLGTRDALAAQSHFVENLYCKTHLAAESRQRVHIARCLVAKVEVIAFVHFQSVQAVAQNVLREIVGSEQ